MLSFVPRGTKDSIADLFLAGRNILLVFLVNLF